MLESDLAPVVASNTVYLKDYRAPDYQIPTVDLLFELGESSTQVTATLCIERQGDHDRPLVLNGEKLKLVNVACDGDALPKQQYASDDAFLTIADLPAVCELKIVTRLQPHLNTELTGLYQSSGNFCTQCEAEGFRRITYFLDRPDVLSIYRVRIEADRSHCPVLLSNGNCQQTGELANNRHFAEWFDPHPKPSYLFALVAGRLERIQDQFVTRSGQSVDLFIYTEAHNIHLCEHAMASLKRSMTWDETVYGREYDLEVYNIVAVDDFNMGAMENKGLNIFNSKYVLADQASATDADFDGIESVIGHEYFHNWSGNRVTCRDWFQLSLKEGFTVFRDQEFSADMSSRDVKRIRDVQVLRTHQFKEDAGPMAHPVRPDSYQEIDNFYTVTIYEKGAEVIRMMYHLVGSAGFRKATDLYFERFDGCAVTTEDFVQCMEDANAIDLSLFRHWYTQAGTPEVSVSQAYDEATQKVTLTVQQHCPPTPNQTDKAPFHIPLKMALIDGDGTVGEEITLNLNKAHQQFDFDCASQPVVSMLRGFSAPVKLAFDQSEQELAHLVKHDNDGFVRFEAIQRLALNVLLPACRGESQSSDATEALIESVRFVCDNPPQDQAVLAELLSLPSPSYLIEVLGQDVDPNRVCDERDTLLATLVETLTPQLFETYQRCEPTLTFSITPDAMARRALRNKALSWLCSGGSKDALDLAFMQFQSADNMTERLAALTALVHQQDHRAADCLAQFYDAWQHNPLVLDKWFAIQAMLPSGTVIEHMASLLNSPAFSIKNPNKVRSLLGGFASNVRGFHAEGGHELLAHYVIQLNDINPQVGARLVGAFNNWRLFVPSVAESMRASLARIAATPNLSKNISEIVHKALA